MAKGFACPHTLRVWCQCTFNALHNQFFFSEMKNLCFGAIQSSSLRRCESALNMLQGKYQLQIYKKHQRKKFLHNSFHSHFFKGTNIVAFMKKKCLENG